MKSVNWADVVAAEKNENENTEFETITPGGYICRIERVEDNETYESLKLVMDIVEGEHKEFGARLYDKTGYDFGYLKTSRKYSGNWQKSFKAFLVALEESNRNFYANKFNNDPQRLQDLLIGVVVGQEEYAGKDKDGVFVKKIRPRVVALLPLEKIRKGDFDVPDKPKAMNDYYKNLMASETVETVPIPDSALPF